MLIILKFFVSKFYLIVLLPNLKCTDDQSDQIDKCIRYIY